MKKLLTLFLSVLVACTGLVGVALPAHADYALYQAQLSTWGNNTGVGPRAQFGTVEDPDQYMSLGAYDDINNIDTKNRPLKIFSGSGDRPIVVQILELPNADTAPTDANLQAVVIDANTGTLYLKSTPVAVEPESPSEPVAQQTQPDRKYVVVAGSQVTGVYTDLEAAKAELNKYPAGANRPSRLIAEVVDGVVQSDPHSINGQNQGGGVRAGFNKWWSDWGDINRMLDIARKYVS